MNRGVTVHYPYSTTNRFIIDGLTISNCISGPTNTGGGILFVPGAWTGTVANCIISDNAAISTNGSTYAYGGGIYVLTMSSFGLTISNCVIRNNQATNTVTAANGRGGGFDISSLSGCKLIINSLIENNSAGQAGGGGAATYNTTAFENCVIRGNRTIVYVNAMSGGGGRPDFLELLA